MLYIQSYHIWDYKSNNNITNTYLHYYLSNVHQYFKNSNNIFLFLDCRVFFSSVSSECPS